jgi:hypothetical protein
MALLSQENNSNTTSSPLVRQVLLIHPTLNRGSAIVVQVVMKLAVSSAELELLQEEWVIVKCECIEDVKVSLGYEVSKGKNQL